MCRENDAKPEKMQTQTLIDQKHKSIKISVCTSKRYINIYFCLGFSHHTIFFVTQSIMTILAFAY